MVSEILKVEICIILILFLVPVVPVVVVPVVVPVVVVVVDLFYCRLFRENGNRYRPNSFCSTSGMTGTRF